MLFLSTQKWRPLLIVFLAYCMSYCIASQVAAEDPTPIQLTSQQLADLERGEILVSVEQRGHLNRAEMYAVVDAPIGDVWEILENQDIVPEWNPEVKWINVVKELGDNKTHIKGVNNMPWPMRDRYWDMISGMGTIDLAGVHYRLSTWEYIKGSGNIEDSNGYWLGEPYKGQPNRTLLKYVLHADIGLWLPGFLVNWATKTVLPNSILGMRKIHKRLYANTSVVKASESE